MAEVTPLPTIWEIPDDLWARIEALLQTFDPPKETGRPRAPARAILNAMIYRFRTGCQWNHLPKELGDDATIHRTFQRWVKLNLFVLLWRWLVEECDELGAVDWEWQAADGWLGKARSGGDLLGPNPTDRAKNGTKKSLLTEARGGPLALVIAPANVNDHLLLEETIEAIVVERPSTVTTPAPSAAQTAEAPAAVVLQEHLCLDKGYDNARSDAVVEKHGYQGHTARKGTVQPELLEGEKHPARRYVVERTIAWLAKCRGLLIRYERKSENYLAQLEFACALLWYRRLPQAAAAAGMSLHTKDLHHF